MLTAPMEWELLPTATVVTRRGATSVSYLRYLMLTPYAHEVSAYPAYLRYDTMLRVMSHEVTPVKSPFKRE
jgi:hypothetical protein